MNNFKTMEKNKRVVVGLSGGVDSSVAAYLLKEQGYEVIGMFMKNWHDESVTISNECPWMEDSTDAMLVAEKLGIPFQAIDLSEEYRERIVDYMFSEYEAGRTPNPDILCNREIKFDIFQSCPKLKADFRPQDIIVKKGEIEVEGKPVYRPVLTLTKTKVIFFANWIRNNCQKHYSNWTHAEVRGRKIARGDLITAIQKTVRPLFYRKSEVT